MKVFIVLAALVTFVATNTNLIVEGNGQANTSIKDIQKGPMFVQEPPRSVTLAFSESLEPVSFECIAEANPSPTYRWFKQTISGILTDITAGQKYTLSNGTLTILKPQFGKQAEDGKPAVKSDKGTYQCSATNTFGTILSNKVHFDFGYLFGFPKTPRDPIKAKLNFNTAIPCNPPTHNPSVNYKWLKETPLKRIRPDLKPYLFISRDSRLYFSRVKNEDAGKYSCIVSVALPGNQDGKTSPPIALEVGTGGGERAPQIHTNFPQVFPSYPMKGDNISIECFAVGTGDLKYSWSRPNGVPMSSRVSYQDRNRTLSINKIELEDAGNYTCTVSASGGMGGLGTNSKTIKLDVEYIPYFTKPLRHHHADEGSDFMLHCEADGKPAKIYYNWYKNGKKFNNQTLNDEEKGRIFFHATDTEKVKGTKVEFKSAKASVDNAMYQCSASNQRGMLFSTAQVRVQRFAPSFRKTPMDLITYAAVGRKATLVCSPEAAPKPILMWFKDGKSMAVTSETTARIHMLENGNLVLTKITKEDEGTYMCLATNKIDGEEKRANTSGQLIVLYPGPSSAGHLPQPSVLLIDFVVLTLLKWLS